MLDIILIVIFLLAFVLGYRKGLVSSLIGFIGTIAALGLAFFLADDVAKYLSRTYGWGDTIAQKIASVLPMPETLAVQSADFGNLGSFYTWLESLPLPNSVRMNIVTSMKDYIDGLSVGVYANMLDSFSLVVAEYILIGLVFLVLWLVLWVVIKFFSKLLVSVIHHTPIIGQIDSIGGALVMLVLCVVVVAVVYNALEMLIQISALGQNGALVDFLHQSKIMPFLKGILAPYTLV